MINDLYVLIMNSTVAGQTRESIVGVLPYVTQKEAETRYNETKKTLHPSIKLELVKYNNPINVTPVQK